MEIQIKDVKQHKLVCISGVLDLYNVYQLRKKIQCIIEEEAVSSLIVDLENLKYIDSSGIALLTHLHRKMSQRQGQFSLMGAQGTVQSVLVSTKLDKFFNFKEAKELSES